MHRFASVATVCVLSAPVGCAVLGAHAREIIADDAVRIVRTVDVDSPPLGTATSVADTHRLPVEAVVLRSSGWETDNAIAAVKRAAQILAQCGIVIDRLRVHEVEAPAAWRDLYTPNSRRLAQVLNLPKPTIYFVADTRNRPAFDAEAVGRGNGRARPEMIDTVWITSATRDPPIVVAHELAHVLANSGEHSQEMGNLMRDETNARNDRLAPQQCRRMVSSGVASGLLQPLR